MSDYIHHKGNVSLNYDQRRDKYILSKIDTFNSTDEFLSSFTLTQSTCLSCVIRNNKGNTISDDTTKYAHIMKNIWKHISPQRIFKESTMNLKLGKECENGFRYYDEIGMSYQGKDANGTFREIVHMTKLNRFSLGIHILLKNGKVVRFKIDS